MNNLFLDYVVIILQQYNIHTEMSDFCPNPEFMIYGVDIRYTPYVNKPLKKIIKDTYVRDLLSSYLLIFVLVIWFNSRNRNNNHYFRCRCWFCH